jgi:Outer membrane protein beta-barrel domain
METGKTTGAAAAATRLGSRVGRFRLIAFLFVLSLAAYSQAQEQSRFTADVGGGVTPLSGNISDRLNTGWNAGGSAGINFNSIFSTSLRFNYNRVGVDSALLRAVGTPDGHGNIWSLTLDPKLQFASRGRLRPYVVGGFGYYRRTVDFTQPVLVRALFFDPFFGFFNALVTEDLTVKRVTKGGVGGNLGAGFDIKLGDSGVKIFSEARYEYGDTGDIPTRMIPVRFGLRW